MLTGLNIKRLGPLIKSGLGHRNDLRDLLKLDFGYTGINSALQPVTFLLRQQTLVF